MVASCASKVSSLILSSAEATATGLIDRARVAIITAGGAGVGVLAPTRLALIHGAGIAIVAVDALAGDALAVLAPVLQCARVPIGIAVTTVGLVHLDAPAGGGIADARGAGACP